MCADNQTMIFNHYSLYIYYTSIMIYNKYKYNGHEFMLMFYMIKNKTNKLCIFCIKYNYNMIK